MYRPKGWIMKQPVAQALEDISKDEVGMARVLTPFEISLFELGADAILDYLTSQEHQDWLDGTDGKSCAGRWVFIPEENK